LSLEPESSALKVALAECFVEQSKFSEALVIVESLCGEPSPAAEALLLHATAGMSFRRIAEVQGVSLRTAQGRYRYATKKLRSTLIRRDGP